MYHAVVSKIISLVGQSPNASAIHGSMTAHITEHVAYQYRKEMEKALGTHLPPLDEALPPDVEASLAPLLAQASGKVLNKGLQEAEEKKNKKMQEDPVIQLQMREMKLKEEKAKSDDEFKKRQLELDQAKIDSAERIAGARIGADVVVKDEAVKSSEKIAGLRAGVEAMRNEGQRAAMEKNRDGQLSNRGNSKEAE